MNYLYIHTSILLQFLLSVAYSDRNQCTSVAWGR